MKKFLALTIAALFVFGISATAFAIHAEIPAETQAAVSKGTTQVTIGGNIRTRGRSQNNTADFNDKAGDHKNWYDQRVRLDVTAQVAETTSGYMSAEAEYTWGDVGNGASGIYPYGNQKGENFKVLEGWINHNFGPVSLKVGHMPLALGNKLFFDHTLRGDDAILLYADPAEGVHVAALTAKFDENIIGGGATTSATPVWLLIAIPVVTEFTSQEACEAAIAGPGEYCIEASTGATMTSATRSNDDRDAYVVLATYSTDMFSLGGDLTWVRDRGADTRDSFEAGLDLYNLGVRGSVNAGPVLIKADVEYQMGDAKGLAAGDDAFGCANTSTDPLNKLDCGFKGLAWLVSADANLEAASVGLEIASGSGDDKGDDDKIDTFVTSLNPAVDYYTFVYDTRAIGASGTTGAGVANTTYAKVRGNMSVSDALSLYAALVYLTATEKVNLGGAVDNTGKELLDDDLGIEVDAKVTYNIARNLKYWVEGGYFMPGDAYRRPDDTPGAVLGSVKDADDAYAIRHGLELSF